MMYQKAACLHRTGRARRGTSLIEMAVVFPIVVLMLLGAMDMAMLVYAYTTVAEAARGGARYAMVNGSMSGSPVGPTADNATVATIVQSYAPAFDTTRLTVHSTWPSGSNNATCPVTVSTTYTCPLIIGHLIGVSSVNVTGSSTMLITH